MELIVQVCGRKLGTKKYPEKFGRCDQEQNHLTSRGQWRGCSSPELRKYQSDATKASRARDKARKAREDAKAAKVEPDFEGVSPEAIEETADERFNQWWYDNIVAIHGSLQAHEVYLQKEKAEREAYEQRQREDAAHRAEEVRYLAEAMDKHDAGAAIDEKKLHDVCISYLRVPKTIVFKLDRESRIKRNSCFESERHLAHQLFDTTGDESFKQRLAKFLGVVKFERQSFSPPDTAKTWMQEPVVSASLVSPPSKPMTGNRFYMP